MAELTDSELALLNSLVYCDDIDWNSQQSLADVINNLDVPYNGGPLMSDSEKTDLINCLKEKVNDKNSALSELVIQPVEFHPSNENNPYLVKTENGDFIERVNDEGKPYKQPRMVTFVDSDKNPTVIFKGTEDALEWEDNVIAAKMPDSPCQLYAKEYTDTVSEMFKGKEITVSGHSKGGNKAMYVAVTADYVKRCVAFDGEGFSNEFCETYEDRINSMQDKMKLISSKGDFVNCILRRITSDENTYYTDTSKLPESYFDSGFASWHKPNLFVDENGELLPRGEQSNLSKLINKFVLYAIDMDDVEVRDKIITTIGKELLAGYDLSNPEDLKKLLNSALTTDNKEALAGLVSLTLSFIAEEDFTLEDISSVFEEIGIDTEILSNPILGSLLNSLSDISGSLSEAEYYELIKSFIEACDSNGIKNAEDFMKMFEDGKAFLKILDIYYSMGIDNLLLHKFVNKFLSADNISNILSFLIQQKVSNKFFAKILSKIPAKGLQFVSDIISRFVFHAGQIYLTSRYILENLQKAKESIEEFFAQVGNYIKEKVKNAFESGKDYIDSVKEKISDIYNSGKKKIIEFSEGIKDYVSTKIETYKKKVSSGIKKFFSIFQKGSSKASKAAAVVVSNIEKPVTRTVSVQAIVVGISNGLINVVLNQNRIYNYSVKMKEEIDRAVSQKYIFDTWNLAGYSSYNRLSKYGFIDQINSASYAANKNLEAISYYNSTTEAKSRSIFDTVHDADKKCSDVLSECIGIINTINGRVKFVSDAMSLSK